MEATHQVFKVSKSTIQKWEKQLKETGNLEKKELHRSFRKIDPEKLKAYVAAQMGDRILAPFQYNGTMDSRLLSSGFPTSFCLLWSKES